LDAQVSDLIVSEGWTERLESLVGRRRDLWVVVGLIAIVLGGVLFLRLRTPPPQIAPPAVAPPPTSSPGVTTTPAAEELFVHVAGAVRRAGLYRLPQGSRVSDAIDAAGGASRRADVDAVNLAELLVDGVKIDVPVRGGSDAGGATAPVPTSSSTPAPSVIDINSADASMLETIPGIGPVLAGAIVSHRDDNGPFPSVDALLDVSGIGPATLESVRPYVRV
jgi:competence protein ComEA